jgi:hypothetical protein
MATSCGFESHRPHQWNFRSTGQRRTAMNEKMKPAERYGLIVGIVGVVVAILGAFFGWLAFQASWTIATDWGSAAKLDYVSTVTSSPGSA